MYREPYNISITYKQRKEKKFKRLDQKYLFANNILNYIDGIDFAYKLHTLIGAKDIIVFYLLLKQLLIGNIAKSIIRHYSSL